RPKDDADRCVLQNADYASQILEEGNIKKLEVIDDEASMVKVRLKLDNKRVGPRAGKSLKAIGQALEQMDAAMLRNPGPYPVAAAGQTFELSADDIQIAFEGPANLKCSLEQDTFMALDTTITPELAQEGLARDFNRLVQDQRKAMNLNISDRIVVIYSA